MTGVDNILVIDADQLHKTAWVGDINLPMHPAVNANSIGTNTKTQK